MSLKPGFIIILINIAVSQEATISNEFDVVSTSQRPSDLQKLTDQISKLEQQIKYGEILKENNRRLDILEFQTTQIQNTLNLVSVQTAAVEKSLQKFLTHHKSGIPTNCQEVQKKGNKVSGMYLIQPEFSPHSFMVLCDMETRGGGWTYFLNRFDGSQDFHLNWTDYKKGFGSLTGEFFLGLEYLHLLTGYEANELLIELTDFNGVTVYALYNAFAVGSEIEEYPIKILGAYSGNAGDSLRYHSGMKFTTQDRDNDLRLNGNCAIQENGSWWYNACTYSNLTAKYLNGSVSAADKWQIMYWSHFRGPSYSLKEARMMVKPRSTQSSSVLPNKTN